MFSSPHTVSALDIRHMGHLEAPGPVRLLSHPQSVLLKSLSEQVTLPPLLVPH